MSLVLVAVLSLLFSLAAEFFLDTKPGEPFNWSRPVIVWVVAMLAAGVSGM